MALRTFITTSTTAWLRSLGLGLLGISAVIASLLLVARPSYACWDGVYVETSRVTLTESGLGDRWTPELARDMGIWMARVEALLPDGVLLTVQHGIIEVCGAQGNEAFGCVEPDEEWTSGKLERLFERVAEALDVDEGTRAAALAVARKPMTVQLGSFKTKKSAERLARRIEGALAKIDADVYGYIEVGGFPANNVAVHVVTENKRHRVVVGAYLDHVEAKLAAAKIAAATKRKAYVRAL